MTTLRVRIGQAARWWDEWWFREAPPHILTVFRIAFGAFLFFYWLLKWPIIPAFSSAEGLLLPWTGPWAHPLIAAFFTPPPVWCAYVLYIVLLAALACLTIGWWTRVACTIALTLNVYEWILTLHHFNTSFDRLFLFTLAVLMLSGCGKALSVDMRLKHGSWRAWESASVWPQRILAVQIAATYLGVGWQKLILPSWQDGQILVQGFTGLWATPPAFAIARLHLPGWFYDVLNEAIKFFECVMPFGLWTRWKWWFFAGGAAFHIAIAIFLGIWWFLVLVPAYVVFLTPEQVYGVLNRIR